MTAVDRPSSEVSAGGLTLRRWARYAGDEWHLQTEAGNVLVDPRDVVTLGDLARRVLDQRPPLTVADVRAWDAPLAGWKPTARTVDDVLADAAALEPGAGLAILAAEVRRLRRSEERLADEADRLAKALRVMVARVDDGSLVADGSGPRGTLPALQAVTGARGALGLSGEYEYLRTRSPVTETPTPVPHAPARGEEPKITGAHWQRPCPHVVECVLCSRAEKILEGEIAALTDLVNRARPMMQDTAGGRLHGACGEIQASTWIALDREVSRGAMLREACRIARVKHERGATPPVRAACDHRVVGAAWLETDRGAFTIVALLHGGRTARLCCDNVQEDFDQDDLDPATSDGRTFHMSTSQLGAFDFKWARPLSCPACGYSSAERDGGGDVLAP